MIAADIHKGLFQLAAAGAVLALLSACDNGPSAVASQQAPAAAAPAAMDTGEAAQVDHRKDPVRSVDGKPMWSASRKFSAESNAQRAFARNGKDFGTGSVEDFVQKAHDFVSNPPPGTDRLVRANGDTLLYDPKGNVFAVVSKAGAPRTMFKPDEGKAYWDKQKALETRRQTAKSEKAQDDGEG